MKRLTLVIRFVIMYGLASVIGIGIGLQISKWLKGKTASESLKEGKCYIHKSDENMGLEGIYVHKIHKKSKSRNYYISEQWDAKKGWYEMTSTRYFPAKDYKEIDCPKNVVYEYNEKEDKVYSKM